MERFTDAVQSLYCPSVAIYASEDAKEICAKNGLSIEQIFQAFGTIRKGEGTLPRKETHALSFLL